MVSGNRPAARSRSSSPDSKNTNSEFSAAPAKYTGKKQSPADTFRTKSKKPSPESNEDDDTLAESDISELPTTSVDYMRENLQSIIDSSTCVGPCDSTPPSVSQDPQCGCPETEGTSQRSPAPAPEHKRSPSSVRESQEASPPSTETVSRNKTPGYCFRMKPKRPSLNKGDSASQSDSSRPTKSKGRWSTKKTPEVQPVCEDTTGESGSFETTPKSLEFMRESLQNIIDTSLCDGPCSERESAHAPAYREGQCDFGNSRGASMIVTTPSRGNCNPNSYPSTPAESFSRTQSRCVCNPPAFPPPTMENYSARGGSNCVCNATAYPVTPMERFSARGSSTCVCNPTVLSVTPMENYPERGGSSCTCNPLASPVPVRNYPVRGPSKCICDPALCNSGCRTNMKVFPPPPNDACCDCNLPISPLPDEECPCDCEPGPESTCVTKRSAFERFRCMFGRILRPGNASCQNQTSNPYYTFQQDNMPLPRRLVFNLVDGIPSGPPPCQNPPPPRKVVRKEEKIERIVANSSQKNTFDRYTTNVDVYYFDHGNAGYYQTTDNPPPLITDEFLERSDRYATEFWANIFGVCHVGISYVTIFFLQLFRFICYSFIRSPIVGFIQILADYIVKPILSIIFNGIIQTIFILFFNIATSLRDLCEPLAHSVGFFLREIAHVFRAIRLVELNTVHTHSMAHPPKAESCKRAPTTTSCRPCGVV